MREKADRDWWVRLARLRKAIHEAGESGIGLPGELPDHSFERLTSTTSASAVRA
ncbi:hypothetical protein [Streptomyces sp. WM6372]|uniref:hypothetical protein n=1 Tax=Streptomyces sp. WM6372 TaxID=1415555 RepID=UPI00131A6A7E|nr:hypothetical protein [Streptomyces sp. WM6372]